MTERTLTERDVKLLEVVAAGKGRWDTREIDITMSVRYGPSRMETVMQELRRLERMGFLAWDRSIGVGGRWAVTEQARSYLEGDR